MTWSRGLFRLWIVFSFGWMVLVGFFVSQNIADPYYGGHTLISGSEGVRSYERYSQASRDMETLKQKGRVAAFEIEEVPGSTVYVSTEQPEDEQLRRVAKARAEAVRLKADRVSKARNSALKEAVAACLIPPAVLFVVGFSLIWAFKGFRGDSRA